MRKAREHVEAQLEPGEQIQALFFGQTGPSPRGALSWGLTANLMAYWTVALTDRNIVVVSNTMKRKPVRLPREPMQILEEKGRRWWFPVRIGRARYWVATEQYDIVVAANELLLAAQREPAATAVIEDAASAPYPPSAFVPAAWYPDPTGRHQQRYWDGQCWTPDVADQGVQSTDRADQQ